MKGIAKYNRDTGELDEINTFEPVQELPIDLIAERIDELELLCGVWQKRRNSDLVATATRRAIIDLCREITEAKNKPSK